MKRNGSLKFVCKNCNEQFEIPYCRVHSKSGTNWSGNYCGRECRKQDTIKKHNAICKQCGSIFQNRSAPSKNGITQYCSRKCWNLKAKEIGHQLAAHLDNDDFRKAANEKKRLANRIGPQSHSFKNGFTVDHDGYLKITSALFGRENVNKLYHRYLMEQHIGRKLSPEEIIHHKDHDKLNNSISNLEITTRGAHASHHHLGVSKPLKRVSL